jgi:hypothetical protein
MILSRLASTLEAILYKTLHNLIVLKFFKRIGLATFYIKTIIESHKPSAITPPSTKKPRSLTNFIAKKNPSLSDRMKPENHLAPTPYSGTHLKKSCHDLIIGILLSQIIIHVIGYLTRYSIQDNISRGRWF